MTVAGPISPKLHVSTSGTDSDFVVKLIDVYPYRISGPQPAATAPRPADVPMPTERMGGYQQLVRGEPMRAKFRNSWEKPEPMTPGKVEAVNFDMPDVLHTFRRGHRIMVQVQSSWFPLGGSQSADVRRHPEREGIGLQEGHRARLPRQGGRIGRRPRHPARSGRGGEGSPGDEIDPHSPASR